MNIKELAERIVRNDGIVAFSPAERDLSKAVLLLLEDGERLADVVLELIDSSPYEQDKVIAAKALAQHKQTVEGL